MYDPCNDVSPRPLDPAWLGVPLPGVAGELLAGGLSVDVAPLAARAMPATSNVAAATCRHRFGVIQRLLTAHRTLAG
jgi:hypothetical protein